MKSIDDLVADRLYAVINYLLNQVIKPDLQINNVAELDEVTIARLKEEYGIEGVILDVDETIRKNMKSIPQVNQRWIQKLRGQLKVIIVSNGRDQNIKQYFEGLGIDYIDFAKKPLRKSFIKACERIGVAPEKVLVIGDNLFCDIHGGKKNNMKTALVKRVEEER